MKAILTLLFLVPFSLLCAVELHIASEHWPQRVMIKSDTRGILPDGDSVGLKAGTSFVFIRKEGDVLYLSGRPNALSVPVEDTDFIEQAQLNYQAGESAERGICNALLVGRLRYALEDGFHPVQVVDSDLYETFLFVYLEDGMSANAEFIPMLKQLYSSHFADDVRREMIYFNQEATPMLHYDFMWREGMPWKTVVFHMSKGYEEAFQHDLTSPACVLTDKHGTILESIQFKSDSDERSITEAKQKLIKALKE